MKFQRVYGLIWHVSVHDAQNKTSIILGCAGTHKSDIVYQYMWCISYIYDICFGFSAVLLSHPGRNLQTGTLHVSLSELRSGCSCLYTDAYSQQCLRNDCCTCENVEYLQRVLQMCKLCSVCNNSNTDRWIQVELTSGFLGCRSIG